MFHLTYDLALTRRDDLLREAANERRVRQLPMSRRRRASLSIRTTRPT